MTKEYVHRKEALGAIEYYSMKIAKEQMSGKEKCRHIVKMDCRQMQPYMQRISLELSRTEFLWNTDMLDTRTTMKAKYQKDQSWCPHCLLGRSVGVAESPADLLECEAYSDLRRGIDPELVDTDRAPYLQKVVARRKELEEQL